MAKWTLQIEANLKVNTDETLSIASDFSWVTIMKVISSQSARFV